VAREDDGVGWLDQDARALGDSDDVVAEKLEVVGAVLGRSVGQAMTPQVHGDEPHNARGPAEPARDRRPRQGGVPQPGDRHDAGGQRRRRPAPVEEVDPVAA
jgi:hypothetical protein